MDTSNNCAVYRDGKWIQVNCYTAEPVPTNEGIYCPFMACYGRGEVDKMTPENMRGVED